MKRRRIKDGQEVVLIYITNVGYVKDIALCKGYRRIILGKVEHEVPVFLYKGKEITGLDCFWLLPENSVNDDYVLEVQKRLCALQVKVLEISMEKNYIMPQKIKDPQIEKIAKDNVSQMNAVIEKFGFDPRDETWIETELAHTDREKNWFAFERENGLVFSTQWDDVVSVFNQQYNDSISVEQAKNMSKKRMRYYLGAHHTRMSGNSSVEDWKKAAREFEETHRNCENRMLSWTLNRQGKYPMVRIKKPVRFWPGPYFHQFLEKVPHIFTGPQLKTIKTGVILRVISYDPVDKYIRLDFTEDVRKLIKPDEPDNAKIWLKDKADYDIWIKPEEVESHLEILEPL